MLMKLVVRNPYNDPYPHFGMEKDVRKVMDRQRNKSDYIIHYVGHTTGNTDY